MEMSVSSEMTFFTTKQQSEICPHLRTGSSAEDRGRIDTSSSCTPFLLCSWNYKHKTVALDVGIQPRRNHSDWGRPQNEPF